MKNLLNDKSRDRNARLSKAQTPSSYNSKGKHVDFIIQNKNILHL